MNTFAWPRFIRVFANDLILLKARRIAMASLALIGLGLLVYLTSVPGARPGVVEPSLYLFPILLLGGGLVFTSIIYGDMHHPLERFHYLTLPCSNLERFVSRYLITAPLYYVYALVLYFVFEQIAKLLCLWLFDATFEPFDPADLADRSFTLAFFVAHAVVYAGAIWFRSFALVKTAASLFGLWLALTLVFSLTMRLVFWDSFISLFELRPDVYINLNIPFMSEEPALAHKSLLFAAALWVLFLGYLGLRDHEVQDGL